MSKLTPKLAAQMYSLREELAEDPEFTFHKLNEIGFQAIQLDGMRGHEPERIQKLVKKYQFKIAGMHIKHNRFFEDLDGIIGESYLFGCKTIYDKYIDDEHQNQAGYIETKKTLHQALHKLAPLGFRVGLHCPEYDYNNQINGRNVLSYITDPVGSYLIYAEPDTYWMKMSGHAPLTAIEKFSGRAPILHLKDTVADFKDKNERYNMTELGSGSIDFQSIIHWGEQNGVEYYCIEQDHSKIGMFASMEKSFKYLQTLKI